MESRKKRRILLQKEVIINDVIKGYILDVNAGGMYIHTQAEFIAGDILNLSFTINEKQIKVKGVVRHTQPGVGIGIKYLNLSPDDFFHIKRFVNSQPDIIVGETRAKKILIVDDNAQSRTIYRYRLLGEGFSVIGLASGAEVIKRLQETKFDLVILDLWMEGIDGFKILQIMKASSTLRDIPVIILSAKSSAADLEKAIALGARDYLIKMSTTPVKLAEKVKEILGG